MVTFTFFDLMSALRQIRRLNFHEAAEDVVDIPIGVRAVSRNARTWEITTSSGHVFQWAEDNASTPIISEVASPARTTARFNYFDVVAAIRGIRTIKFTTGGVITLAIPQALTNHSRNSSVYSIATTNGEFSWTDDNTAGPTTISEI